MTANPTRAVAEILWRHHNTAKTGVDDFMGEAAEIVAAVVEPVAVAIESRTAGPDWGIWAEAIKAAAATAREHTGRGLHSNVHPSRHIFATDDAECSTPIPARYLTDAELTGVLLDAPRNTDSEGDPR